jgi:hypothetical protein
MSCSPVRQVYGDSIEAMLVAKFDGRPPEELIGSKIEQFRLSMQLNVFLT